MQQLKQEEKGYSEQMQQMLNYKGSGMSVVEVLRLGAEFMQEEGGQQELTHQWSQWQRTQQDKLHSLSQQAHKIQQLIEKEYA